MLIVTAISLLVLIILPIDGQLYFGYKKLKGENNFPFYAINLSAIVVELIATSVGGTLLINVFSNRSQVDMQTCITGAAALFGLGITAAFIVQPIIALAFYIKSFSNGTTIDR